MYGVVACWQASLGYRVRSMADQFCHVHPGIGDLGPLTAVTDALPSLGYGGQELLPLPGPFQRTKSGRTQFERRGSRRAPARPRCAMGPRSRYSGGRTRRGRMDIGFLLEAPGPSAFLLIRTSTRDGLSSAAVPFAQQSVETAAAPDPESRTFSSIAHAAYHSASALPQHRHHGPH